jgi:hypothetical protein
MARIIGKEINEVDTDGCPSASICIHLKNAFGKNFC